MVTLRANLTLVQTCSITEEQYAEVEARLKAATAKDAHKRFASPSFPPELRLEVMKAGVLQNTSSWHVNSRGDTVDKMRNRAFSSLLPSSLWNSKKLRFDPTWLDSNVRGILANAAKQAFLENMIFKIDARFTMIGGRPCFVIPQLLEDIGAHMNYLELAICTRMDNVALPKHPNKIRNAIQDMKSLKRHFPHLKTCILTLDVSFRVAGVLTRLHAGNAPTFPMFDKRLLQSSCSPHASSDLRTLSDSFAKLFEVFADEGPGKSRFVRIRSRSMPPWTLDEPTDEHCKHFSYGPLVRAERIDSEDTSLGARLVDAAYKLDRIGPRLLSEEPLT